MTPLRNAFLTLLIAALSPTARFGRAQAPVAPAIAGTVTDPSGALIQNAEVTLHPTRSGTDITGTTDRTGHYRLTGEVRTPYELVVTAPGFGTFVSNQLQLNAQRPRTLDVHLKIADPALQVDVTEDPVLLSTDPNRNGDSLVFSGDIIDMLPIDPHELLNELQGLAGSAKPDIYVDGFSGGALPARDIIREIRINQNPYSAQYDTTPGTGRVEIFTKPGSNKFHGNLSLYGNDDGLNTVNPFAGPQPPYYAVAASGDVNGPIGKNASFFLNGGLDREQVNAFIDAETLDPSNAANQIYVKQAVFAPTDSYNLSNRFDFALGPRNTLTVRYLLSQTDQTNAGVGQLALSTQGYNNDNTNQVLQLSNTRILTGKIVNDTRFQYTRGRIHQIPDSTNPTLSVEGAFTGGGNTTSSYNDNQDNFELQDYVSAAAGKHFLNLGARFRSTRDANRSNANYNGTYTFACLVLSSSCSANAYQPTLLGTAGGGASQFSITQGNPSVAIDAVDLGLFVQDDWKTRPNLTVSAGLRFESQNYIADHGDWAPRFGLAWTPYAKQAGNAKPRSSAYTIRAGAGIFYHRFAATNILLAQRQNGVLQQQYVIDDPAFFYPNAQPQPSDLAGAQAQSTIYRISPAFHAPYYLSGTVSLERRIGNRGSITASWVGIRGDRTQFTRNANAPEPGTYNPAIPNSGTRPLGGTNNIYEFDSEGVLNTNRLNIVYSLSFGRKLFLFGSYQLQSQNTDANETFVSNSYNIHADYGRALTDMRHQAWIGSSSALPGKIRFGTYTQVRSGTPFNINVGEDLNGDSIFNDRPAFATDLTRPSVVFTRFGNFDTSPIPSQTIVPINYGHGPGFFVVNTSLTRTVAFGPRMKPAPGQKGPGARRFSADFGFDVQNLFNQANLAPPVGTLDSPLFGKSIALATGNGSTNANRIVQLDAYFHF